MTERQSVGRPHLQRAIEQVHSHLAPHGPETYHSFFRINQRFLKSYLTFTT